MACRVQMYLLLLSVTVTCCLGDDVTYPLWKVFCSGVPLYRGRLDSIISPGDPASHVHKVAGGNHFSAGVKDQTPLELYEVTRAANCTTCSIHTVDLSNYWHPDLYYRWPNGTFSLVPDGGLTVYYEARTGDKDIPQNTTGYWQPFPKGFRMIAGNPYRRTFNASSLEHQAISFVCLTESGPPAPETKGFQTDKYFCKNGFRMQVYFPMCWDGVNIDSPNHQSHVAYPSHYNGGDCPATHPVRLPGLFYEAFYAVDKFPHGQGVQPFVLANGDPTGYGFHGDFVNGWDVDVVRNVLTDPTCDAKNTNEGNNPERCLPLQAYVKKEIDDECELFKRIPLTENVGMVQPIRRLPGCNPITYANATPCSQGFDPKTMDNNGTFYIQSKLTGLYLTYDLQTFVVSANASTTNPNYRQVWGLGWAPKNLGRTICSSEINMHFTIQDLLKIRGEDPDTWEIFSFDNQPASDYVAIRNLRYNQYLKVEQDFTISGQATSVTDASLFKLITPDGGYVPEGLKPNGLRK